MSDYGNSTAAAGDGAVRCDSDVLIVGAGPVGMTLALLLAKRGRSVAIYERRAEAYPLPRAAAMSHETVRTFQSAGVLDRLRPHLDLDVREVTAPCYAPDGEVLMTVTVPGLGESGYPPMTTFHQPDVDQALGETCDAEPLIALYRGWDARSIDQDDGGVTVAFHPFEGEGDAIEATARFVVGCDGANSTIQNLIDTEIVDSGFSSTWLIADTVPIGDFVPKVPWGTIMDPARPALFAPAGVGRQRYEFMVVEGDDLETITDLGPVMALLEPQGVTVDNSQINRRAVYTFRGRWAENWRDGRVLLAGDAAHQMPPFLGQGLNSGVRDAVALAWRLDLILRGTAAPALLDSYTSERSHHVNQITQNAIFIGQMMCTTDPVAAEQRNQFLRVVRENPAMAPPQPEWKLGPGCLMPDDPAAGFLALQATVEKDGHEALLGDLIDPCRFTLIGNGVDPLASLSDESQGSWAALDGLSVNIGDGGYRDVDGAYAAWFAKLGAAVVLTRPDFQVFGASANVADADEMVTALAGHLQMERAR